MLLVYMICMVICGNGAGTGMGLTHLLQIIPQERIAAKGAYAAEAAGIIKQDIFVQLFAKTAIRGKISGISDSVL